MQTIEKDNLSPNKGRRNSNGSLGEKSGISTNSRKSLDRRIPDTIPRNDRLKSRTPLGSLEVLDDDGLLDGGIVVPNYYTSLRQRSRRCLEMKARSIRLRDRGKQVK